MLPEWNQRNSIIANLLNPAFTGEIIRCALKGYSSENKRDMDFALVFILLPIILHEPSYNSLPRTTRKKFFEWYENSKEQKINLSTRIKEMVPFTRETINFLIYYNGVTVVDSRIHLNPYRKKSIDKAHLELVQQFFKKSEMVGKWLAKSGSTQTIFATLGISP